MERNARVVKNLNAAIETMRQACAQAERDMTATFVDDETACQRVLHVMAWGFANASSGIEAAMDAVQDAHAMEVEMLKTHNAKVSRGAVATEESAAVPTSARPLG